MLIDYYFSNASNTSGNKFISFLISSKGADPKKYQRELKELKTFYDCYTSLTLFLINFLESELKSVKLKIQNLDNLNNFKRLNKFFDEAELRKLYEKNQGMKYELDVYQYERLKLLSEKSINDYTLNRLNYYVSDNDLIYGLRKGNIRSFLIDENIPIQIEIADGREIIHINAVEFKNKLKSFKQLEFEWYVKGLDIPWLCEDIRKAEKKFKKNNQNLFKASKKLQKLGIYIGDVLFLKTDKLVIVAETIHDNQVYYKYNELTVGLTIKKREGTGRAAFKDIIKYLPQKDYERCKVNFQWQHKDLVKRYIRFHGMLPKKVN